MLDILAAITKSASRNSKNLPRTVRARVVHPTVARTIVIPKYTSTDDQSCGNAAASAIHNGIDGIEIMNSMILWIIMSIAPPKYPEIPPIILPRKKLSNTPTNPIEREIREAYIFLENRSRPNSSVPKGK